MLDHTHSPDLTSWVSDANGHPDFPIQNLPLGIFSPTDAAPRPGIAIGDHILDLAAVTDLLPPAFATIARARTLNTLMGQGKPARAALRHAVSTLLAAGSPAEAKAAHILHRAADCTLHLPAQIGDYTDFYAGIHHANAVGKLFRPDQPLMPNYKHVPIAYHGRASSIRPSGEPFHRPNGQLKNPEDAAPHFGPSRRLDYELELGVWIGPGNAPGAPIPIADAADHIAGFCLLNDWSARDIQAWEYQPLGPSWRRISPPPSPPGSSRRRRWPPSAPPNPPPRG